MHWYVLSKATGVATLCAGEHDARRESKSYDRLYPRAAPHVAVRLVPVLDTASSDAVGDISTALGMAMQHIRICAPDPVVDAALEKALNALRELERSDTLDAAKPAGTLGGNVPPVGASIRCTRCGEQTEVAFNYGTSTPGCCNQSPCAHPGVGPCLRPARPAPTDSSVALAIDWARANAGEHAGTIIEALAAYDPECGGRTAQAPERRAVTDEDIQRAAAAIALVANPHVVSPAACTEFATRALESFAGVPAAQPAPDAGAVPVVFRHVPLPDTKWKGMFTDTWLPFMPQHRDYHEKRAAEYGWRIEYAYLHPASAASEAADAQLADTQRAIIEAAEARGYARAKTEGEADARDESVEWVDSEWPMQVVRAARADDPSWLWWKNNRCKYIELRIDTRDGHCVIKDRNGKIISLATLCKQTGEPDFALAAQQRKGG